MIDKLQTQQGHRCFGDRYPEIESDREFFFDNKKRPEQSMDVARHERC